MTRAVSHPWSAPATEEPVVVGGSVAGRLAHTQHRPVLLIPARPSA
jgi:hypothetical protein